MNVCLSTKIPETTTEQLDKCIDTKNKCIMVLSLYIVQLREKGVCIFLRFFFTTNRRKLPLIVYHIFIHYMCVALHIQFNHTHTTCICVKSLFIRFFCICYSFCYYFFFFISLYYTGNVHLTSDLTCYTSYAIYLHFYYTWQYYIFCLMCDKLYVCPVL